MKKVIGITLGEPLGIGPELVLRGLPQFFENEARFVIYGSRKLLEAQSKLFDIPAFWMSPDSNVDVIDCGIDEYASNMDRAKMVLASLEQATKDIAAAKITSLVTAPIDKAVVRNLEPEFTGHTSYLAKKAGVERTVMMLDNTELRVALLTEHVAHRDVAAQITSENIIETTILAAKSLHKWFGIEEPRMALAGLNPHAGEITSNSEEEKIMKPTVMALIRKGFQIEGPLAADSLFPKARNGSWDLVLSPYHDQGLVAAKYPGLDKVVNITLGLPYIRVSPGHGVAYDIAGRGKADIRSFERAIRMVLKRSLHV